MKHWKKQKFFAFLSHIPISDLRSKKLSLENAQINLAFLSHIRIFARKNEVIDMKAIYPILLLLVSNVFMTFAWYGHLRLQQIKIVTDNTPLFAIVLLSWMLALPEYCCSIPANRIGFAGNGGAYSLMQLKVIQEVISLIVFMAFSVFLFAGESLHWNHFAAFVCLILAVYFAFLK